MMHTVMLFDIIYDVLTLYLITLILTIRIAALPGRLDINM
jgi:hypothetical protein